MLLSLGWEVGELARLSLREAVTGCLSWMYSIYWESKRYGMLSRLDKFAVFVSTAVVPVLLAISLSLKFGSSGQGESLRHVSIAILGAVGVGHLIAFLQQRHRARPPVQDVHGVRKLRERLGVFAQEIAGLSDANVVLDEFRDFASDVVDIACEALCSTRHVRGTLMLHDGDFADLAVVLVWPESGDVDPDFLIRLETQSSGRLVPADGRGVAGFTFTEQRVAYVPNKAFPAAWFTDFFVDGVVDPVRLGDVWKPSDTRRYRSVVSAPVTHKVKGYRQRLGVLNLESGERDSFGDADFHLAEIFASSVGEALVVAMEKRRELREA